MTRIYLEYAMILLEIRLEYKVMIIQQKTLRMR